MRRGLFVLYKLIGVFFVLAALGKTLDSGQIIAVFTFLKIPAAFGFGDGVNPV